MKALDAPQPLRPRNRHDVLPFLVALPDFKWQSPVSAIDTLVLVEALRSATVEPARFLDLEGQAGVIRPGARADIVLLRKNPLDDIGAVRNIETVILAGAVYDREDLENLLVGVESAAGSWAMWPRFIWQILNSPIMKKQFGV